MAKISGAVSNSGPLIHLSQVNAFGALKIFSTLFVPEEVYREVTSNNLPGSSEVKKSSIIKLVQLLPRSKDFAKIIAEEYEIGLGEAEAISLAKQERVKLFLTDDAEARTIGRAVGLEVHGTIGVVLRALREGVIGKKKARALVKDLQERSTLYLTSDLVDYILKRIERVH